MSTHGLKIELRDGIRVLTLANPPANALTPAVRRALMSEIADAPGSCQAIVLQAEGPAFSSDQPLDPDPTRPKLADLCRAVAECPMPVVAVLQGLVTGPGAELALAARARLADPSCRIAFSGISLGLCTAGGASFRLPWLIGAKAALQLLLTGRPVPAAEALSLGLIDGIVENSPLSSALRLGAALAVGDIVARTPPDAAVWAAAIAAARREQGKRLPAAQRIIDCVEAALVLPTENAQAFELTALADLEATPEAAGLHAAARAERTALAAPAVLSRLQPLSVDRIGLSGSAPDLARLAVTALSRDLAVTWVFDNEAERRAGLAALDAGIGEGQRVGSLSAARARDMTARLLATGGPGDLVSLPMVVRDQQHRATAPPDTSPGAARLVLGGAAGEIGLSLAPAGRACELTLPGDAHPLARATALSGLRRIGLAPVIVGARPVVGARMADAGRTALAWMISHGVPRRLVTTALDGFGVQLTDTISAESPAILRAMPVAEVLNRWLAALANEGARLLGEGLVRRPSDIDYLMVAAQAFPRWRGGPMHQADLRGLMALRADLRAWGTEAQLWSPAPLIDRLIGEGKGFAALNR